MIVSKQYSDYVSPLESSMSSYPNILTPPSSSEDSPQSVYLVASPTSNTFEYENYQLSPLAQAPFIMEQQVMIDPNHVNIHPQPEQDVLLHFIEQPTDRFRFRYKSEMAGTHGSLTGINSDKSRKPTYPTVELKNCSSSLGRVIVRCSIYQSNAAGKDMLPHAHRLIMKKGKEEHDDPHDIVIGPEDGYRAVFQGMGIIHTAKKNIVTELTRKKMQLKREAIARAEGKIRELITKEQVEIKGLAESESKSINLNIVCLRFDAFIRDRNILYPICEPIFSHGINNLKSALTGDLKIVRLDHVISPAKGNKEIFILVERVTKKNIRIRFYEVDDEDKVVWEDWGRFNDLDVHHQYAIVFKTPKYHDENITSPVHVLIELYRPSDGARSEPRDFRYIPNFKTGNKRPRYDYSSSSYNSSNMDSDELPVPINNLHIEQHKANPTDGMSLSFPSEELNRALNNIDSNEFKKLFSENEQAYDTLEFDAPRTREQPYNRVETAVAEMGEERFVPSRRTPQLINIKMEKMEVSNEDRQMANKDIAELRSFIRTTHKPQIAMKILKHYFGEDEKTNALHVSVSIGDNNSAELLLKIIAYYRQFEILEKSNNAKQTPLHLAILTCNKQMVSYLILCKARICSTDSDLNTALHLAILKNVPVNILELLLKRRDCEETGEFIDMENKQGNTALVIAIEKNNMVAIKLLCRAGADLNKIHPKNGYVPLRFAVEKKQADIVRYFLTFNSLNPTVKDFQNISPLTAALAKEDSEEIVRIVKKYMADNNLPVEVKEEPEDDSEEEMEIDEEVDVKTEFPQLSSEELEKLYKDVTNFTPQCLDEVSSILDKTENWKCLAELLEIEHLVNSEIITSDLSMSKAVLVYSIETNHDSIWMIRNFLENLDEFRAVELIDRMVQEIKKS